MVRAGEGTIGSEPWATSRFSTLRRRVVAVDTVSENESFHLASRSKLTLRDLDRFGGTSLFHRVARAVCGAEALPRKELYEAWEVARRVRRRFRGGRVVDLACGHAFLAHVMLVLDDSSPSALAIDVRIPQSAAAVARAMVATWPRLEGRVQIERASIEDVELRPDDVIVSAHACGGLTDAVLTRAIDVRARVAVLPCCQSSGKNDRGGLAGWLEADLAIDVTRVARLRHHGFRVHTQRIPEAITPKNRLILASP
jgi:hypothetical protein